MAITEEQLKEIVKLHAEDKRSYKEISAMFPGTTRDSIAGLLYRYRHKGKVPSNRYAEKPKRVRKERKKIVLVPVYKTIYELKQHDCRYPTTVSESNEQLFCSEPIEIKMYCQKHFDLCHTDAGRMGFKVNTKKFGRI